MFKISFVILGISFVHLSVYHLSTIGFKQHLVLNTFTEWGKNKNLLVKISVRSRFGTNGPKKTFYSNYSVWFRTRCCLKQMKRFF